MLLRPCNALGCTYCPPVLAGTVGIEPTIAGVKVLCLTIWLHPYIGRMSFNALFERRKMSYFTSSDHSNMFLLYPLKFKSCCHVTPRFKHSLYTCSVVLYGCFKSQIDIAPPNPCFCKYSTVCGYLSASMPNRIYSLSANFPRLR